MNFVKTITLTGQKFHLFNEAGVKFGINAELARNCQEEGLIELDADMLQQVKRSNKYLQGVENTKVTDAQAQAIYTASCAL